MAFLFLCAEHVKCEEQPPSTFLDSISGRHGDLMIHHIFSDTTEHRLH
jgi:hypothetical protein